MIHGGFSDITGADAVWAIADRERSDPQPFANQEEST
jgi:hypothetical protein